MGVMYLPDLLPPPDSDATGMERLDEAPPTSAALGCSAHGSLSPRPSAWTAPPPREFVGFPKIPRLFRDVVVTEKIDGTNAAVVVTDHGDVFAQSRRRIIFPADDNFGFARWVEGNRDELAAALGVGRHFGEWFGSGIQRGYGLPKGEKRLALFNTARWDVRVDPLPVEGLGVVPILYTGPFDTPMIVGTLKSLARHGSFVAPGFANPEGIVVYHSASRRTFKATIDNDASTWGWQ